jgi:DNA-binding transcriptional LysR family regulator
MLDLNDFYYFVHIVDRGGFTAAGHELKMPKSTLSYRMRQLEMTLGLRLLNRTSRQFAVTEAGRDFYRYAVQMLRQAEEAEAALRRRLDEPTGTVRVTAAKAIMQFAMSGPMTQFLLRYPKVNIVAHATDHIVDIVGDNFDVAIRAHSSPLPDSTLVQRTLATVNWELFASAPYTDRKGLPSTPQDLQQHDALFMMREKVVPAWYLEKPAGRHRKTVALTPRLLGDDMINLKDAALAGLGIVALPAYVCRHEVSIGSLVRVLPGWIAEKSSVTALVPNRQGLLPSVRTFLDHLAAALPLALQG